MRQSGRGGYTACLRACMAAYRKLRDQETERAEIGEAQQEEEA